MKDEALKLALRLCEEALPKFNWGASSLDANAIELLNTVPAAIKEALAQPAQEPVGFVDRHDLSSLSEDFEPVISKQPVSEHDVALYTPLPQRQPVQREWLGLTDEEVNDCIKSPNRNLFARDGTTSQRIARATEAKLKEKNT